MCVLSNVIHCRQCKYSDDRGNALERLGLRSRLSFTCSLCLIYRFLKLQPEGILHSTKPPMPSSNTMKREQDLFNKALCWFPFLFSHVIVI